MSFVRRVTSKGIQRVLMQVEFDLIAQCYVMRVYELKTFYYSRRSSNQYDISHQEICINISPNTPHILSMINQEASTEDVKNAIKLNWQEYFAYANNKNNENWIRIGKTRKLEGKEKLTEEQVKDYLSIQTDDEWEKITKYSPY